MATFLPDTRWNANGPVASSTGGGTTVGNLSFLPGATWRHSVTKPVASRETLNNAATSPEKRQLTMAAEGSPIRVTYGTDRIGARVADILLYGSLWVYHLVWGEGEIDAVQSLEFRDSTTPPVGMTATHYMGTSNPTVNATLVSAYAAQSPAVVYADTLPGIARSVVTVPVTSLDDFQQIAAVVRGRKLYDPRENRILQSHALNTSPWAGTVSATSTADLYDGKYPFWKLAKTTSGGSESRIQNMNATVVDTTDTVTFALLADTVSSVGVGIYNGAGSAWGANADSTAAILSGPGSFSQQSGGLFNISGLSTTVPTLVRITRTYKAAGTAGIYIYPGTSSSTTIGHSVKMTRVQFNAGSEPFGYCPTTTSALAPQTVWSDNPALALADFLSNSTYGAGRVVDWVSVTYAANACDELVNGAKRRTINLTLDSVQNVDSQIEVLRTYAGCWVVSGPNGLRLIPDRPAASVKSFTMANIERISPLKKRGTLDTPTIVRVYYTDTSTTPWKESVIPGEAEHPGLGTGAVERIESDIHLPGINNAAQAKREAIERLNKLTLSDLSFTLDVFDDGLIVDVGDVVSVTHVLGGLENKLMRVLGATGAHGRYTLELAEYDAASYSDEVATEPSSSDTTLPLPTQPLPVTNLAAVEELFQFEDGTYGSRIRATWTAPAYPVSFIAEFRVNVRAGGTLVFSGTAERNETTWASADLPQATTYQVDVVTVSIAGATADASDSVTTHGKNLVPGDVPSLSGFEVAGEVRLTWTPAVDVGSLRYEVRYVAVGGTWENALLIDRTVALRCYTKDVPTGTWDFLVKALDDVVKYPGSPGQYSVNATRRTITVTSDSGAFLVDAISFNTPTLSNMTEYGFQGDTKRYFVTDDGVAWNTKFSAAMSTYTNPLRNYGTVASSFTDTDDFGATISGNWRGELTAAALVGAVTEELMVGPNGTDWTMYPSMSAKTAGRFVGVKASGDASSIIHVTLPTAEVRVDAVSRAEQFSVTTLSSGGALVQLTGEYSAVKSISMTSQAASARIASYDRVLVAPATGLVLQNVVTTTIADAYAIHKISAGAARVIASGDYLEYDVFIVSATEPAERGGMNIYFTDATAMSSAAGTTDANGSGNLNVPNSTIPVGQWFSRKHSMTNVVGKTISHVDLVNACDVIGENVTVYRNIRITDGAGTTRLALWSSGEPSLNTTHLQNGQTQIQCGPSNSLLAYQFDAAGTQTAGVVSGTFNGI